MSETTYDFLAASMEEKELHREDLLAEAKRLNIAVKADINIDTLFNKVSKARKAEEAASEVEPEENPLASVDLIPQDELILDAKTVAAEQVTQAHVLHRVMIVPNDPSKREWQGEYFEASNDNIPPIRKFIQFNAPFHVPQALLTVIKEKMYTHYFTIKVNDKDIRQTRQVPAYSVTVLDNLTQSEIDGIARRQMAQKDTK